MSSWEVHRYIARLFICNFFTVVKRSPLPPVIRISVMDPITEITVNDTN
jgi:hypothetical protein